MGCGQSKIDNEESVSRCKARRNLMKEAVSSRNAFASAHSGYAMALKDTGAALSDYAQGEAPLPPAVPIPEPSSVKPPPPLPSIMEPTLLPPPPPPSFSPVPPLQRAMTMPELSKERGKMKGIAMNEIDEEEEEEEEDEGGLRPRDRRRNGVKEVMEETPVKASASTPPPPQSQENKGMAWDYFFMVDNIPVPSLAEVPEEEDFVEEKAGNEVQGMGNMGSINEDIGFKTPEKGAMEVDLEETPVTAKEKHFMHSNTAPPGLRGEGSGKNVGASNVDLLKVLGEVDDHFLKASECAQEVSKMLEATRLHYHSNFADNRGHIDHEARVMRVITWNKSFRGVTNGDGGKDEYDAEEYETHATVLDKLLAWEKKLYEEVKAGETIKFEYQRKIALLNKMKKRGASTESLEKTKAAVSHLHTRYIVDMQSLDSTVSEVNDIRDRQLYPKLVDLVHGMARMWESMGMHHDNQLKIMMDIKSLDVFGTALETSKYHHERTIQLSHVVQDWHSQFEKLVGNQKEYIRTLNSWLKLNLIPIESSLKEKVSSPPRIQTPPIQPLLHSWHEHLEKLPDELAKSAIASFAAVMKTIIIHQEEEMKLKEKCEETRKEYSRKRQAFDDWSQKYMQRRTPPDETDPDRTSETNPKDPIAEKEFVVESLKKRLEEEMEAHQKHCIQVREKSLGSLKVRLPEIFRAMSDYSHACFDAYQKLSLLTESLKSKGGS